MKKETNQKAESHPIKVTMQDLEDMVNYYSSKASEYCHQLGIAGVVIVWVLNNYATEHQIADIRLLRWAFLLFIISITISLLHYMVLAIMSDRYYHKKEDNIPVKSITELRKELVEDSKPIEYLSWTFFGLKFATLLTGYFAIIYFVYVNLFYI